MDSEVSKLAAKWRAEVERGTGHLNDESDRAMLSCADEMEATLAQPSADRPDARDAVALIAAERQRQITSEGWSPEHDDAHATGELAAAAACYAFPPEGRVMITGWEGGEWPTGWPWNGRWWKPGDRTRELVKAGALIVAEIERLQRAALAGPEASDAVTACDECGGDGEVWYSPESYGGCYVPCPECHEASTPQADPAPSVAVRRFDVDVGQRGGSVWVDQVNAPDGELMEHADHARIVARLIADRQQWYANAVAEHEARLSAEQLAEALAGVLQKIAVVNAMDYEYQRWAREALSELLGPTTPEGAS